MRLSCILHLASCPLPPEKVYRPVAHPMRPGEFGLDVVRLQGFQRVEAAAPEGDLVLGQLVQVVDAVVPVRGIPPIGTDARAEVVVPVEVPLADVGRGIASIAEALAERLDVVAQRHVVGPRAGRVGINAGEQPRPRGRAHRTRRIRPLELDARFRQPVDVGRAQFGMPIRTNHVGRLGVSHDENEVGSWHSCLQRDHLLDLSRLFLYNAAIKMILRRIS